MNDKERALSHEELRSRLDYDPSTGVFKWKPGFGRKSIENKWAIAGTPMVNGYIAIAINRRLYLAHRLAWFFIYKEWPYPYIDHIDRNRKNNVSTNLRICTVKENSNNNRIAQAHRDPCAGVRQRREHYEAVIKHEGVPIYLGTYVTQHEATAVYRTVLRLLLEGKLKLVDDLDKKC